MKNVIELKKMQAGHPLDEACYHNVLEVLTERYVQSCAHFEVLMHKARAMRTGDVATYFGSTNLRDAFGFLMVYARGVNQPYTISEISAELMTSRQSVYEMVKDCQHYGWIDTVEGASNVAGRQAYQASQSLHDSMTPYLEIRRLACEKSGIDCTANAWTSFLKSCQTT